ncbi:dihydrofolate reductase [Noviherbaspirillum cavernae]|uniref:Dihydrofolate reductase n=1 Tax=Noviherbaspirillum cavernae TaxID=2320862 RepID=A0A418WVD5_9BURK|nr:dihydrofolate reductase family protein [Noviherbaspirillum cavernae]RJF96628.1 dihydrofolate reductase [Noviherbaspirillum cavernae]
MQVSVYIATSLDGFIARPDGSIDWLINAGNPGDSEDYGYADFMATVDCLAMGRNTFEKALSFPEWPYEGRRVVVLSRSLSEVPESAKGKVELFSGTVGELTRTLKAQEVRRLYIDGGKVIQSFLQAGLVTDMTLTRIPVLIGDGLPLFGTLHEDVYAEHVETTSFKSGFTQSVYKLRAQQDAN